MSKFQPAEAYQAEGTAWEFLPFRFERLNGRVLVTNLVGEHLFLERNEFEQLAERTLPTDSPLVRRLRAKHVIREPGDDLPVELLAIKTRTRYRRLSEFTALHIFVVSLRCEHSCPYCQVSRQSSDKAAYDMSWETAITGAGLDFPLSAAEHQDRVPGRRAAAELRPDRSRSSTRRESGTRPRARTSASSSRPTWRSSTIACSSSAGQHDVYISTSLDGPADLHNKNRPRPGRNSWELARRRHPDESARRSASIESRP